VLDRVKSLKEEDVGKTGVVFVKNNHPRFSKFFSSGLPFGHIADYEGKVNAATLEQACRTHQNLPFPDADEGLPFLGATSLINGAECI